MKIKKQQGATMVEYAIMIGLIAAVCAGSVSLLGDEVLNLFQSGAESFP